MTMGNEMKLLGEGAGNVGVFRIGDEPSPGRINDQVHVLHRDCAKERLISQNHGPHETTASVKGNFDRAHVGRQMFASIGKRDLALLKLFEFKLHSDVLWKAQMQSSGIHQRRNDYGFKLRVDRVAKGNFRFEDAHNTRILAEKKSQRGQETDEAD